MAMRGRWTASQLLFPARAAPPSPSSLGEGCAGQRNCQGVGEPWEGDVPLDLPLLDLRTSVPSHG